MLDLGPQVAIIDDNRDEVASIENSLVERNVGYRFFNADPVEASYPDQPIETINLLFLDLYYTSIYNAPFDAERCAQWIDSIVPAGKKYYLVVWSKDGEKTEELLGVLEAIDKAPYWITTKLKSDYQTNEKEYDITKLLEELNIDVQKEPQKIDEFYGEVISIEDDHVLINCLLDKEKPVFQIRRFDLPLFENYIKLQKGLFILIRITTEKGLRTFEFIRQVADLSDLFEKEDYFKGVEDTPFFKS